MRDKLIGYLLDALEVEETTFVRDLLEVDVEARRQLEVLRLGLEPVESDREHVEAPSGLAFRTCQRIRQARDASGV